MQEMKSDETYQRPVSPVTTFEYTQKITLTEAELARNAALNEAVSMHTPSVEDIDHSRVETQGHLGASTLTATAVELGKERYYDPSSPADQSTCTKHVVFMRNVEMNDTSISGTR